MSGKNFTVFVTILLVLIFNIFVFGGEQNRKLKNYTVQSKIVDVNAITQIGSSSPNIVGATSGTAILAALMANAYAPQSSNTNLISFDPYSGLITIVHRGTTPNPNPTSGYMYYTASFDQGATWTDIGPFNDFGIETVRHPNMTITNPTHSPDPFSLDIHPIMFVNTLQPANWETLFTVADLLPFGGFGTNADTFTTTTAAGPRFAEEMTVNDQTGEVFATITEPFFNGVARHGYYHTQDQGATWTPILDVIDVAANFGLTDKAMLEFAPDGQNGIYGFDGMDLTSSTEWKFGFIETNDGGQTWSGLTWINAASVIGLPATINTIGGQFPWADFIAEADLIVDMNGDPHFVTVMQDSNDANSLDKGVYEIYRQNGLFYANFISGVNVTRFSLPGGLNARNECELSRNLAGDVIYAKWIDDVDSTGKADVYVSARWLNSTWTTPVNETNTPAIHEKYSNLAARVEDDVDGKGRMHIYYTIFGDNDTNDLAESELWYLQNVIGDPGPPVGIGDNGEQVIDKFTLLQNFPNPFNPSTTITFNLPKATDVRLEVLNVLGEKVATLVNGRTTAGEHTLQFDGSNLSSGIYLYTLTANNLQQTRKMILMK